MLILNNTPHQNIQNVGKRHIPRDNRRKHNPHFTPEIQDLISQHDTLRVISPKPFILVITLNTEIDTKIKEQQKINWKEYLNTLDLKTNISKLYKTINRITVSNSNTIKTHAF